jgi:uncharacterized protein with PIN domain
LLDGPPRPYVRSVRGKWFSDWFGPRDVTAPAWLADEMLGRLARYLRFFGHDTEYVRGLSDAEISARARSEGRRLLTRDRQLAREVDGSILIASPLLADQLRQLATEVPEAGYEVSFVRCTLCNGDLRSWSPATGGTWPEEIPRPRVDGERPIFECTRCGHRYWEGSHTEQIRRQVAEWRPT